MPNNNPVTPHPLRDSLQLLSNKLKLPRSHRQTHAHTAADAPVPFKTHTHAPSLVKLARARSLSL